MRRLLHGAARAPAAAGRRAPPFACACSRRRRKTALPRQQPETLPLDELLRLRPQPHLPFQRRPDRARREVLRVRRRGTAGGGDGGGEERAAGNRFEPELDSVRSRGGEQGREEEGAREEGSTTKSSNRKPFSRN